jgi:hypothetical protein
MPHDIGWDRNGRKQYRFALQRRGDRLGERRCPEWVKLGGKGTPATGLVEPNDRTLSALTDSSGSCQDQKSKDL